MRNTHTLDLILDDGDNERAIRFQPTRFIVAGWTGRNREAMEKHIVELEALGIKRPQSTPVFYRNSTSRLTTAELLQIPGDNSSGEVEFVLFNIENDWWVGVGSDHTDRDVEKYNITVSKQMCDKPIASKLWRYSELRANWDSLKIKSHAVIDGKRVTYQDGTVAAMLSAEDLVATFEAETETRFGPGDVIMGGTLAAISGVRAADSFEFSICDENTGRTISHKYTVQTLPMMG